MHLLDDVLRRWHNHRDTHRQSHQVSAKKGTKKKIQPSKEQTWFSIANLNSAMVLKAKRFLLVQKLRKKNGWLGNPRMRRKKA